MTTMSSSDEAYGIDTQPTEELDESTVEQLEQMQDVEPEEETEETLNIVEPASGIHDPIQPSSPR